METNTKRNEHPACSCKQCRRGAGSTAGQHTHALINRSIRRQAKIALKSLDDDYEDFESFVVSTPYTD